MTDFLIACLLSALFVFLFATIEILKRRFKLSPEITRRFAHIASGCVVLLEYYYLPSFWILFLMIGGGILFFIASRFQLLSSINNVSRKTYGQYVLTAGYVLSYLISLNKPEVFVPSLLIVTFADSMAGLVGSLRKSPTRTTLGSLVFFSITLVTILIFTLQNSADLTHAIVFTLLYSLALTTIEKYTPLGFDNLTVPTAAALLLLTF